MSVHCFTSLVHSFTSLGHHFHFSLIDLSVMGRAPCCDKANVKRGPWSPEEDTTLRNYVEKHGTGGNWIALPQKAGLRRCGKSCRLRWLNYLRPNIKHGGFTEEEDNIICTLYKSIGSRWSVIASHLPGRTDNDVKNYWNTKLKKKLLGPNANFKSNSSLISNNHFQLNPSSSLVSIKGENHGIFSNPANGSLNTLSSIELGFQKLYPESIQFPPSGLSETFGFGVNANGQGFRTDNSQFSWSGIGNGEADSFLMDMENLSTYDLLHVCSSQEMGGVAPNSIS